MVYTENGRGSNLLDWLFMHPALEAAIAEQFKESALVVVLHNAKRKAREQFPLFLSALPWINFCALARHCYTFCRVSFDWNNACFQDGAFFTRSGDMAQNPTNEIRLTSRRAATCPRL